MVRGGFLRQPSARREKGGVLSNETTRLPCQLVSRCCPFSLTNGRTVTAGTHAIVEQGEAIVARCGPRQCAQDIGMAAWLVEPGPVAAAAHMDCMPQGVSHIEAHDAPLKSRTARSVATMDFMLGKKSPLAVTL